MTVQTGVECVCVHFSLFSAFFFFRRFASIPTSAELKELGQKRQAVSLRTDKDESTAAKGNAGAGNKKSVSYITAERRHILASIKA